MGRGNDASGVNCGSEPADDASTDTHQHHLGEVAATDLTAGQTEGGQTSGQTACGTADRAGGQCGKRSREWQACVDGETVEPGHYLRRDYPPGQSAHSADRRGHTDLPPIHLRDPPRFSFPHHDLGILCCRRRATHEYRPHQQTACRWRQHRECIPERGGALQQPRDGATARLGGGDIGVQPSSQCLGAETAGHSQP
ncbi:hypothetical protein OHA40_02520 [Nocardia sp. NBC_00508]|uniref:hypothetical protein n=1 Tax=Nocardia sp. NBC_00508 TaxID=2975992 RepID=UPI002E8113DA|nr:hypothetical protein [Nocardia sp. NBC_00508]WUD67055.1 hypothetical protein OHA40_02520 [Nocardia sp. NBC_00508]